MINFHSAEYLMGAPNISTLPENSLVEIAFAGRSNAGKSSAINCLTGQKALARISKQPGRTQLINFFTLNEADKYIVDLPGYGYAKVSKSLQKSWQKSLNDYITLRDSLKGIVLFVDIRHGLKKYDEMMIEVMVSLKKYCHIVLTKSDRSTQKERSLVLKNTKKYIESVSDDSLVSLQIFSALKSIGKQELADKLNVFYENV